MEIFSTYFPTNVNYIRPRQLTKLDEINYSNVGAAVCAFLQVRDAAAVAQPQAATESHVHHLSLLPPSAASCAHFDTTI